MINMTMISLARRLTHAVDIQLPGFERVVPPGSIHQLALNSEAAGPWFRRFVDRVVSAVGHVYFPVYRMADGEFIFCVGPKAQKLPTGSPLRSVVRNLVRSSISSVHRHVIPRPEWVETCWGERYTTLERRKLMPHFVECVTQIANRGCLAVHFTRTAGRFAEEYFVPMCHWFDAHKVPITRENYVPFYFVYALLCGPERFRLFSGRRILVVASGSAEKQSRIRRALTDLHARDVIFLTVSENRALMDRLDLSKVPWTPDLVLVAAGIGAANVLSQLAPLRTVCIDAGICVEALADPSRRERDFMVPDVETIQSIVAR